MIGIGYLLSHSFEPNTGTSVNYLFHLVLSGPEAEIVAGNFMGDFVKGPLGDDYPPRVRRGLELHRGIDSFAQRHPSFNRSRQRLDAHLGLYRGVLVDLYYDHFLARGWDSWSEEPLPAYLARVRAQIEGQRELLPARLRDLVPMIFEQWLPSYAEPEGIALVLERMSRRVARKNPLAQGGEQLLRHYAGLMRDFSEFLPAARDFAAGMVEGRAAPKQGG